jgi:hypothetical protein
MDKVAPRHISMPGKSFPATINYTNVVLPVVVQFDGL